MRKSLTWIDVVLDMIIVIALVAMFITVTGDLFT